MSTALGNLLFDDSVELCEISLLFRCSFFGRRKKRVKHLMKTFVGFFTGLEPTDLNICNPFFVLLNECPHLVGVITFSANRPNYNNSEHD